MIEISDEYMAAMADGKTVATARWSWYAAADGGGGWTASTRTSRLLSRDQASPSLLSDLRITHLQVHGNI